MIEKSKMYIYKISDFLVNNFYLLIGFLILFYSIKTFAKSQFIYGIFYVFLSIIFILLHFFYKKLMNRKIMNFFPKNKLIMLIFVIVIITSVTCFSENNDRILYQESNSSGIINPVISEPYYQEIYTKDITIDSIAIRFATYTRKNIAEYYFKLIEDEKVIFEQLFNSNILVDGKYYKFKLSNSTYLNPNNHYKIEIIPINATSENCITIFQNVNTAEINYQLLYDKIDYLKIFAISFFVIIYLLLNYIINTKEISINKFYALCSVYLLATMILVPPFNVPDEPVHYYRAYKLSQFSLDNTFEENFKNDILFGPDDDCINYSRIEIRNKVSSRKDILKCAGEGINEKRNRRLATSLSGNNPINHIFASVGIKISDIFTNSPLIIFFSGRLANLIISFLIIYFAIKIAPKNKLIILFVATLPMFVQQMASYSYDSVMNSATLLLIAYLMKLYEKDNLKVFDWILIFIMGLFIYCAKSFYLLIMIPLFFVKIKDKKKLLKRIILILGIILLIYLVAKIWPTILNNSNKVIDTSKEVVKKQTNLNYLMENPFKIFSLVYNTSVTNGWFYLRSLFGYFGWFVFSIDNIYIWIYLIMMFILINTKSLSEKVFGKMQKMISIFIGFLIIAGAFAAMYFHWSSYKLSYIDGVQGRYFLPSLGLLLIAFIPKKQFKLKLNEKDIFVFINSMFLMFIILLICKYY